jgi:predicted SAM-dependent methyltransferase
MKNLNRQCDQVCLNVASSTSMLEGFINLDNHVLLTFLRMPRIMRMFLSSGHRDILNNYEQLIRKHTFIRHDCRKPLPFTDGTIDHILCSHFLEHVFASEAEEIISDFRRVLKLGGTIHIILPDILEMARKYVKAASVINPFAADEFIKETLLSRSDRGSLKFRFLEMLGGYGLNHKWMYDNYSIGQKVTRLGFILLDINETPSKSYRYNDGSIHIVARKN